MYASTVYAWKRPRLASPAASCVSLITRTPYVGHGWWQGLVLFSRIDIRDVYHHIKQKKKNYKQMCVHGFLMRITHGIDYLVFERLR
jgi:hypothetical protein